MTFTSLNRSLCNIILLLMPFFWVPTNALQAMELNDFVVDSIGAHPGIREQVHVFREVERDRDIADSGWLPSVDIEASTGTYETTSPVTSQIKRDYESNRIELSVTQNLFNGFDTEHQQKQAAARISSALYEIFDIADNIALDAVQAYLDVLKNTKLVDLAETNVRSHERILSQIRERNESGVGRRSELQQTEGRVARAHASLIAQQNNLQDAATGLHEILGRYIELSNLTTPEFPQRPEQTLNELIDQALEQHPAIKVAGFNVQSALADSNRARSNRYPTIDLRLAKEVGNDLNGLTGDTDELSLVLNLRYNLYRGGADKAEEKKKISIAHQNQAFFMRVRRQVINTLRLAWAADKSLSQQLKYLHTHIEKSRQTVESYSEEFFIGQRDLIDLLDAESELNGAEIQYAGAHFDALAARYRILEAMGSLFPALNLQVSVGENDLNISKIKASGNDILPLNPDEDADKEKNISDHCDNTLPKDTINEFGCHSQHLMAFGFTKANHAPVVGDDELKLDMNSLLIITQSTLLENDTDEDGDELTLVSFTQPENGVLAFDDRKNLIYRVNEDFSGTDSFNYTITDGQGAVATAVVKLIVIPVVTLELSKTQYVNYIFGTTDLTEVSKNKVMEIVDIIKDMPYAEVEIFAYTDDVGSERFNLKLSKKRAESLYDLLISFGLGDVKITVYGMGEKDPIADNSTKQGRAINRRGELHFKLITKEGEGDIPDDENKDDIPTDGTEEDTASEEQQDEVIAEDNNSMKDDKVELETTDEIENEIAPDTSEEDL